MFEPTRDVPQPKGATAYLRDWIGLGLNALSMKVMTEDTAVWVMEQCGQINQDYKTLAAELKEIEEL